MSLNLGPVTVKRIQGRESVDPVTSQVTRFVSFSLDGDYPYAWAFADDLQALPAIGSTVKLNVSVRAKKTDQGARLSVRVLGWE